MTEKGAIVRTEKGILARKGRQGSGTGDLTFQDKLRAALKRTSLAAAAYPSSSALLLDISGSMGWGMDGGDWSPVHGQRRIDSLRTLVEKFPGVRKIIFSWDCAELAQGERVPEPEGGTNMALAFKTCKTAGISHVVLISDGIPDNCSEALEAARGLKVDVFYVGPDPVPGFLLDLAKATGGEFGKESLATKEIEGKIRLLLPSGKEPISL